MEKSLYIKIEKVNCLCKNSDDFFWNMLWKLHIENQTKAMAYIGKQTNKKKPL